MRKIYNLIITTLLLLILVLSCDESEETKADANHVCAPCTVCADHVCPSCTVCADHVCPTCPTCTTDPDLPHVCPPCETCANHVCPPCTTCANHVCAVCPNCFPLPPVDLITIEADAKLVASQTQTKVYYEDNVQSIDYFWSENDSVTVCFKHEDNGIYNEWQNFKIKTSTGKNATFTAEYNPKELENFPSPEYKYLWAISPAVERVEASYWSYRIMCDASEQTITNGLLDLSAAYFTARSEYVPGEKASFVFEPRMAHMTFKITLPAGFDKSAIKQFAVQGKGLYDTRVISIEQPNDPYFEWKDVTEGEINISFNGTLPIENNELTVSMMLFPTTWVNSLSFNIVDGLGVVYARALNITSGLEVGKRYNYEFGFSQSDIERALDAKGLNTGTLLGSTDKFLARYAFNDARSEIKVTYFEGRNLVHKTVSTSSEANNISWEAITLDGGIIFDKITYDKIGNLLTPNNATTKLKSQKNVVAEMKEMEDDYLWIIPANAASSSDDRTEVAPHGDAKDVFNTELADDVTIFDIRLRNSGTIAFWGHGGMRDIYYHMAINEGSDIVNYSAYDYDGDNSSPAAEYAEYDGSARQYHLAKMPKTHEAWFDIAGLIVVLDGNSYYLLSPTTDTWFKFTIEL